jgi:hypothetical protein
MKTRFIVPAFGIIAAVLGITVMQHRQVDAAASYNPKAGDPCSINMRLSAPINAAAGAQIVTGTAGKQTYICGFHIVSATAQNIALVEGTGSVCATNTAGMAGGATAATGWNFGTANLQLILIGSGANWVLATATAGDNVCLLLSSTGQTSGSISYVQQ